MNESIDAPRRAVRLRRIGLVLLTVGLLLGVGGMPTFALAYSDGHPAPLIGHAVREAAAPSHTNLSMNLTDRPQFQPQFVSISVNSNLSIQLHNTGRMNHSFTVSKVPNVILNRSWDPTQLNAFFAANGSLANVTVTPGSQTSVNLSFNATSGLDSFEFVSIVPYQFQAGMWGFINVSGGPGLYLSENTTNSLTFVPSVLEANVSHFPAVLNVQVTNLGALSHTWTLGPWSNYTLSPGNFTTYFQTHPPLANVPIPSTPGQSAWANFTIAGAGVYQYICTIPGHFQGGMTGFLYINTPPPAPQVPPSTAIVQSSLLIGTGVLLGIGVVLVAVASLVGRFPKAAPRESEHHY
jgi:uncharacterized cupredoxin-like copper-binding protein